MRYKIIVLLLIFTASLFSAETNKIQIIGNGQKVANEFVDKKKLDSNMELCAGLQIETDLVGLSFESDNGIVSKDEKPGFYILYLSADERKVTVLCSGFEPLHIILRNYGIGLEKGGFYKIKVTVDKKVGDIPVNIISSPAGATLFVDGVDYGLTETLLLSTGKHKIKLEKTGFTVIEAEIAVNLQNTLFTYYLAEEDPAKLKISSDPVGASVYIDGTKIGITPFTKFYPPNVYKIRIEKELFETIEEQLTIKLPETAKSYTLIDNSAFLTINTLPKAKVFINDERVFELKDIRLAPQFVEIKVTLPRAEDLNRRIMLKKGERLTLDLVQEIAYGKLQITVTPDDADIAIVDEDNKSYDGKGALFKNIPAGDYSVTVKMDGYKTITKTITINENQKCTEDLILEKKEAIQYLTQESSPLALSYYNSDHLNKMYVKIGVSIPTGDFGKKLGGYWNGQQKLEFNGSGAGNGINFDIGGWHSIKSLSFNKFDIVIDYILLSWCYNPASYNEVDLDDKGSYTTIDSKLGFNLNYQIDDNVDFGIGYKLAPYDYSIMSWDNSFNGETLSSLDFFKQYFNVYGTYNRFLVDMQWKYGKTTYIWKYRLEGYDSDFDIIVPYSTIALSLGCFF